MTGALVPRPAPKSDSDDDGQSQQPTPPPKPSLHERLKTADAHAAKPPKPKPFHMSEPFQNNGGLWCFWLAADENVLHFVGQLNCIMSVPPPPFARPSRGRVMFGINPRYDHEETWMWIYRLLEGETERIELSDLWDDAIEDEPEENDQT